MHHHPENKQTKYHTILKEYLRGTRQSIWFTGSVLHPWVITVTKFTYILIVKNSIVLMHFMFGKNNVVIHHNCHNLSIHTNCTNEGEDKISNKVYAKNRQKSQLLVLFTYNFHAPIEKGEVCFV